jgi:hypothetical protein
MLAVGGWLMAVGKHFCRDAACNVSTNDITSEIICYICPEQTPG